LSQNHLKAIKLVDDVVDTDDDDDDTSDDEDVDFDLHLDERIIEPETSQSENKNSVLI